MGAGAYLRGAFQETLNCAIADGVRPSIGIGLVLGEQSWTAIEAVARQHPDATVELIADAYDAFAREHEAASTPVAGPPAGRAVSALAAPIQATGKATSSRESTQASARRL